MSQVIDITKKAQEATKKSRDRRLDIEASCVIIEKCLQQLNINNLKEIEKIKKELKQTLDYLRKI